MPKISRDFTYLLFISKIIPSIDFFCSAQGDKQRNEVRYNRNETVTIILCDFAVCSKMALYQVNSESTFY